MTQRAFLGSSLFLLAASSVLAQAPQSNSTPDLPALLASWQAGNGPEWRLVPDEGTKWLQMLYGGHTTPVTLPDTDEGYFDLARGVLAQTIAMHGIDASTLQPERTLFLPLGIIGSNDKMTVRFKQVVDGVPVEDGFVNVLFDMRGRLLSIQSVGLPHLAGFPVTPIVVAGDAQEIAIRAFRDKTGVAPNSVVGPDLVVDQSYVGENRGPRLAWKVDLHSDNPDEEASGFKWFVDALTGEAYRDQPTVFSFDVTGTVTTNATPGLSSDNPANPPVQQPLRFASVTSGSTTVATDTNGNFTLPGLTAPVPITVAYAGARCVVLNDAGPAYSLATTLTQPTGNVVLMNTTPTEAVTAQANIYRCALLQRDYIQRINPSDTHGNFLIIGHAMRIPAGWPVGQAPPNCNANYDGNAVNFYQAGSGCSNFAFSTIIAHEVGHWMNDLYGTNNGSDGMGEGNADVWAMYIHDTPINGQGAFNGSGFIRTGLNTTQFCGDRRAGCYLEVHEDGEVWNGAAWKIRDRLNTALGNTAGDLVADSLFLGWMNAYNQTQIKSIIETQWLTLDDNDGNLVNGTPHLVSIDGGFLAQGFPGYQDVVIDTVTDLPDVINPGGTYSVTAHITTHLNPLATKQLKYRLNNGNFTTVNMTALGGDMYVGVIPGQIGPSHVSYYVTATTTIGDFNNFPAMAPGLPLDFDVGLKHVLRSHDFEAATVEGWTHGANAGTDEWQRGIPAGKGGTYWSDPAASTTLTNCWGQDLGIGSSNGTYGSNSYTWLRSPATNCTGAVHTHLRFNRWLSVQGSNSDQARLLVNGAQIYLNPTSSMNDGQWVAQDIDITTQADNNPSVVIEWNLQANNSSNRGGWNIDDMSIVWVEAAPPCPAPVNYCVGAPNSVGPGAVMNGIGTANISNNNLELLCTGCPPNTFGLFYYGPNAIQTPFGNGFRCVGGTTSRLGVVTTNTFGDAVRTLDLTTLPQPVQAGETWRFQFWYRNPAAGGAGFNLSDGLAVTFCP